MKEKYALITGASGEIGSAIALKMAEQGYHLYLHYHQNEQSINELMDKLSNYSVSIKKIQANFEQPNSYQLIKNEIKQLDCIILASGVSRFGLFTDLSDEECQSLIHQDYLTPVLLVKSLIPILVTQKTGSIVLITSIWGEIGASCEVLYSSIKGGQNAFVKSLSKELAPSNIRVNAVSPGAINTKMLNQFTLDELQDLSNEIPMGRLGEPKEIANVVRFLSSDEASYITGQILGVNGGWHTK